MVEAAVRCAFWLGFHLQNRGDAAQASGWLTRARRLVPDDPESYLAALLRMPDAVAAMNAGDVRRAMPVLEDVSGRAARHGDLDAFVLAGLAHGRCLAQLGRVEDSWVALDEIMVHVVAGTTAPQVSGLAYCSVVGLCLEAYDLPRAQEWTQALTVWVSEQLGM